MGSQLWERLRAIRTYKDLRQDDIAAACQVTRSAVAQWEAKEAVRRTVPSLNQIQAISKITKIPVEWILNDGASTDELWQMGREQPVKPVPETPTRKGLDRSEASSLMKDIAWEAILLNPRLGVGFNNPIHLQFKDFRLSTDFFLDDVVIEIKSATGIAAILDTAGRLLVAEKILAKPLKKAIITFTAIPAPDVDAVWEQFGVQVYPVTNPADAAHVIASYF